MIKRYTLNQSKLYELTMRNKLTIREKKHNYYHNDQRKKNILILNHFLPIVSGTKKFLFSFILDVFFKYKINYTFLFLSE